MSDRTRSSPSRPALSIVYRPIEPSALDVCASICLTSFNNFSLSVAQPPEFPSTAITRDLIQSRIGRPATFHLMAASVQPAVDGGVGSGAAHWVDGLGEVLGLVVMDCGDEAAGLGPLVVSTTAQGRGVGRALMERCIDEASRRGIRSIRLVQIVANIAAFSLYHSLGFRACEYAVAVAGHISAAVHEQLTGELHAAGVSIRAMERDDLAACNQLHIATTSFSRLAGLTFSFTAQPSQKQHKAADGLRNGSAAGPTIGCYVAVSATNGAVVGYCTGWTKNSHCVGSSDSVVLSLYSALSQHLQQSGETEPSVLHVTAQRNSALLDRLTSAGCRAVRQTCLMTHGEYVPPHRYVYCHSILW